MKRKPQAIIPRPLPSPVGALSFRAPVPLEPDRARAVAHLEAGARSDRTKRIYRWAWDVFERWCAMEGRVSLPADVETIKSFIESQVMRVPPPAWSSIVVQLAAISTAHRYARCWSPTRDPDLADVISGARRKLGVAARHPKAPAAGVELADMIDVIDRATLEGKRDAAVILTGFHTALRRSNIAALRFEDFEPSPGGIAVRVRKSKTDQEGEGRVIGVMTHEGPLCAVEALNDWWAASGVHDGLAFRAFGFDGTMTDHFSEKTVARIVKRYAEAAGYDPKKFGGHSLRAGFVTEAIRRGAGDAEIMGTTLHESATMLARYRREADPVARGASGRMKLTPKEKKP